MVPGRNLITNSGFDDVATYSNPISDHYQNRSGNEFKARKALRLSPRFLVFWELTGYRILPQFE